MKCGLIALGFLILIFSRSSIASPPSTLEAAEILLKWLPAGIYLGVDTLGKKCLVQTTRVDKTREFFGDGETILTHRQGAFLDLLDNDYDLEEVGKLSGLMPDSVPITTRRTIIISNKVNKTYFEDEIKSYSNTGDNLRLKVRPADRSLKMRILLIETTNENVSSVTLKKKSGVFSWHTRTCILYK